MCQHKIVMTQSVVLSSNRRRRWCTQSVGQYVRGSLDDGRTCQFCRMGASMLHGSFQLALNGTAAIGADCRSFVR